MSRERRAAVGLGCLVSLLLLAESSRAPAATKLFVVPHLSSRSIEGIALWRGRFAFATHGGLALLDPVSGSTERIVHRTGGLPTNDLNVLAVSPSGSLWIGTERGLARLRPDGTFRRTLTTFDGLPSERVLAMHVRGDSIWVGTQAGAALFTEDAVTGLVAVRRSDTKASTAGALVGERVQALVEYADTLWCATSEGLSQFASGRWIDRTDLLGTSVLALALHEDTLWIGAATGPRRYAGGALEPALPGHVGPSGDLASDGANLYSGSPNSGVYRYTGTGWTAVTSGLPNLRVSALAFLSGGLWAGTVGDAARLDPGSGTWVPVPFEGPLVDGVQRAAVDGAGRAWFTTGNLFPPEGSRGVLLRFDARWAAYTAASTGGEFQQHDAFGLLAARDGRIWVGHCCLGGTDRPRLDRYEPEGGVWDRPIGWNIWALAQSPSGRVYAGSNLLGGGVYEYDGTSGALLDSLTPANTQGAGGTGLSSNDIRAVAFDGRGRGWFAHAKEGLDIWDGRGTAAHADDIWVHFATGLPSLLTTSIATIGGDSGWLGTTAGVARIDGTTLDRVRAAAVNAALPSVDVRDLALDPGGNLWIATAAGLARVDRITADVERFAIDDGLVTADLKALAWDERRGVLWIGGADGIAEAFVSMEGEPGFSSDSYVYPNPIRAGQGPLRLGGITREVRGEVRDLTGTVIRQFRCDPSDNAAWDVRDDRGAAVAPGLYLIHLRDGERSRILRAAVVR